MCRGNVVHYETCSKRVHLFQSLERKAPHLVLLVVLAAAEPEFPLVDLRDASGEISKLRKCCLTVRRRSGRSWRSFQAPSHCHGGCIREAEFRQETGCGLTVPSRTSDLHRFELRHGDAQTKTFPPGGGERALNYECVLRNEVTAVTSSRASPARKFLCSTYFLCGFDCLLARQKNESLFREMRNFADELGAQTDTKVRSDK